MNTTSDQPTAEHTEGKTTISTNPVLKSPRLVEIFIADLGYQLAKARLQNGKHVPTIQGLRTGCIELIPQFSSKFARVTVDEETNAVKWSDAPNGKTPLVLGSYDYYENMTMIALELIPKIDPNAMEMVAFRIFNERDTKGKDGNPTAPLAFNETFANHISPDILVELESWLAGKVIFYGMKGMKLIKEAGFNASFQPVTSLSIHDLRKFMKCQINPKVEDVPETVDHSHAEADDIKKSDRETTVSPWDIKNAIDSNTDMFDITDDVQCSQIIALQQATNSYASWLKQVPGSDEALIENIESQRQRAQEWLDNQNKSKTNIDFKLAK